MDRPDCATTATANATARSKARKNDATDQADAANRICTPGRAEGHPKRAMIANCSRRPVSSSPGSIRCIRLSAQSFFLAFDVAVAVCDDHVTTSGFTRARCPPIVHQMTDPARACCSSGIAVHGWGGIRTHGTLLTYTHFPGVRLKPLGHPSSGGRARGHGQGEIRTHDTVAGMPVFETGAFNHSATCPTERRKLEGRRRGVNEPDGGCERSRGRAPHTPPRALRPSPRAGDLTSGAAADPRPIRPSLPSRPTPRR